MTQSTEWSLVQKCAICASSLCKNNQDHAMDWDDLRFVLETVRQGGLSGAARVLRVNHATVSRRIQAAELALGTQLFDRLPTGYRPTQAGLRASQSAEAMETAQAELSRAIGAQDQALQGKLVVTAPQLMIEHVLAPLLRDFHVLHPEIALTVLGSNETLSLARREADVAIRISNTPDEQLFGRQVTEQRSAVYASKTYIAELAKDPSMPLDWLRFAHWTGILPEVKNKYPNTRVAMVFDDMTSMIGATRADLGATRMPCFLGDADPMLMRLPHLPTFPYLGIWVLTHQDLRNVARIAAFTTFIGDRLSKLRDQFTGNLS
jgi:DNA-binding transcriptional LysR family regulator